MNNQIELRDEDQYRLCIRGLLLDLSKSDCDILSSNLLQKLLLMPPEPEDVQAEREARTELIKDLRLACERTFQKVRVIHSPCQKKRGGSIG